MNEIKNQKYKNIIFPEVAFECKQCGLCCMIDSGDLNEEEYERIVAKGYKEFLDKGQIYHKQIKKKEDGTCFFLTDDNKCMIHDVKPISCKLQPFLPIDYSIMTKKIKLDFAHDCKGISKGKLTQEQLKTFGTATQKCVDEIIKMQADALGLPVTHKKVAIGIRNFFRNLKGNTTGKR